MEIKKGNKVTLTIYAKDKKGVIITDLDSTTEIYFMLKTNKKDSDEDAILSVNKTSGLITVNDPTVGIIKIELNSSLTKNIEPGTYYIGIQLEYTDNIQEIKLKEDSTTPFEKISIIQDIIRGSQ